MLSATYDDWVGLALVATHTARRPLGIRGDDAVNVLELNVALASTAGSP